MSDPCASSGPNTCDRVKAIHKWSQEEKQALRNLAKWSLANWRTLYDAFNALTRELARKGDEINYDWSQLLKFEQELAALSNAGKFTEAAVKFADHLIESTERYLPGCAHPSYLALKAELPEIRAGSRSFPSA